VAQVNVVERVAIMAPHLVTEVPGHEPVRTSPTTRPGPRRACLAPTHWCRSAVAAPRSRTSTATPSSTSRRASPSTPRVTPPAIVRAIQEQARSCSTTAPPTSTCPSTRRPAKPSRGRRPSAGPRASSWATAARAVEAGLKLARRATGRHAIVSFLGGFPRTHHGGPVADGLQAAYHAGFGARSCQAFHHAPSDTSTTSPGSRRCSSTRSCRPRRWLPSSSSPFQGEGGYVLPEDGFLPGLRDVCDRHASCSSPMRSRLGPAARAPCGPWSTGA